MTYCKIFKQSNATRLFLLSLCRFVFSLSIVLSFSSSIKAHAADIDETRVAKIKAAHIFHLAKFTTWPDAAFVNKTSPLNICITGEEKTLEYLKQITKGRKAQGRGFRLTFYKKLPSRAQALACHAIYFGSDEKNSKTFVESLQDKPILSISGPDEALPGTIVIFFERNNKLGIQVDVGLAKRAHLFISAELLSLARVIGD